MSISVVFLMISVYWAISYDLVKAPRYKHESILKTEVDHTLSYNLFSPGKMYNSDVSYNLISPV